MFEENGFLEALCSQERLVSCSPLAKHDFEMWRESSLGSLSLKSSTQTAQRPNGQVNISIRFLVKLNLAGLRSCFAAR